MKMLKDTVSGAMWRMSTMTVQIFPENTGLKLQRRAYIVWDDEGPQNVLLVKKTGDRAASMMLEEIGKWLQSRGLRILVERTVRQKEFPNFEEFVPNTSGKRCYARSVIPLRWTWRSRFHIVDFCLTLHSSSTSWPVEIGACCRLAQHYSLLWALNTLAQGLGLTTQKQSRCIISCTCGFLRDAGGRRDRAAYALSVL